MDNQGKSKKTYFDSRERGNLNRTYFLWLKNKYMGILKLFKFAGWHDLKICTQKKY